MGTYGVIDFDDEEIEAASHWYGGQGSMLYAITSTGALRRGTIRPRHPEGGSMTDEEWIVDLAERLEGEADQAARDAAKQAKKAKGDEKKALIADREGLRSIAFKAAQFVRDAKRSQKSQHATRLHHATKKTNAQLDREIDQTVGKRIDRKKLGEMMSAWGSDFSYGQGSGAIGAVSSYYYSDKKYPDRKWVETALAAIEADISKAEHGAHGWTKADANQLRRIAQGLRYYLNTDYKEHATSHATRSYATRAHASKRDRAADLIAGYKPWTSSYSNEDMDRASSLASRLTDIDRDEGRLAPPVGFSKARYEQARQVVRDTNRYGEKQQALRAKHGGHATKKRAAR